MSVGFLGSPFLLLEMSTAGWDQNQNIKVLNNVNQGLNF
jgi:hypothetical protein